MCGTSRWKAAKSASKAMKNLDETGIAVFLLATPDSTKGCQHVQRRNIRYICL